MNLGATFNASDISQPSSSNLSPPIPQQAFPPSPNTPTYATFPAAAGSPAGSSSLYPPQLQPGEDATVSPAYEAPPSYEDAIAVDIGPIDGPRREYGDNGGPGGRNGTGPAAGSKADRLFPENP